MHSGDATATTAYIEASFSEPSCRDDTSALEAIAKVIISRKRSLSPPVLSRNVTVYSYSGLEERQYPGNYVAKVSLSKLTANNQYFYQFIAPTGEASPLGSFRTLPGRHSKSITFVAFTGLNEPPFEVAPVLLKVAATANFGVLLGDGVYADKPWLSDPARLVPTQSYYRSLYAEQRSPAYAQSPALARTMRTTAVFSMWDDNDVTPDYSGQSGRPRHIQDTGTTDIVDATPCRLVEALYRIGTRTFFEMNAVTPTATLAISNPVPGLFEPRQRLFQRVSEGPLMDVFILDTRQYRDLLQPTTETITILPRGLGTNFTCEGQYASPLRCAILPGPHGTEESLFRPGTGRSILGKSQLRWLLRGLRTSKAKYKVVASPASMLDQFIVPSENCSGYWAERQQIVEICSVGHYSLLHEVIVMSFSQQNFQRYRRWHQVI